MFKLFQSLIKSFDVNSCLSNLSRLLNSSWAVKVFLPFKKAAVLILASTRFTRCSTVKPLSAKIKSCGSRCFNMPLCSKLYTAEMSPSNKSETKQAPPLGVQAIMHLLVFPCCAKLRDVSMQNSLQSTMHRMLMVLKIFGRK